MAAHTTDQPAIGTAAHPYLESMTAADSHTATPAGHIQSADYAAPSAVSHAPTDSSFVTAPTEKPHPHIDTASVHPAPATTTTVPTTTSAIAHPTTAATSGHVAEPSSAMSATSTSGGLAQALQGSGHNVTKTDAQHLKAEIKNERTVVQNLTLEEKRESIGIRAALANIKLLIKDQERHRRNELAAEKKHRARVAKQAAANKMFLKAQEALTEATARTETARAELEAATKAHTVAQQAAAEAERKAEQLRVEKGQHDVEREGKKTAALAKVGDAEKALAESGFKKRFGCF